MTTKETVTKNEVPNETKETLLCSWCGKEVSFHMEKVDHRKELIRTIATLGLWLPLWLCLTAASKTKICDECGNAIRQEYQR